MSYDVLIQNGTVIDGTGAAARAADVAVRGDRVARIAEPGSLEEPAARVIDAAGCTVTPGFVDIHTHLDAQIWWDPAATSSCWHGVTSVVMGNCGVTFAPCREEDRDYLARMMESVEDVPAQSIAEGMPWQWETFGEYLAALDTLPKGINVGGMVGHCAVRYWAMGQESLLNEPADAAAIERMREIVDEAIAAGALGFSTSRTILHRTPDGEPVPGTFARLDELMGITKALGDRGRGLVEAAPGIDRGRAEDLDREANWMEQVSLATGRPVTFGLAQSRTHPEAYAGMVERIAAANARGARVLAQSTTRGIGVLFGFVNRTPFDRGPSWRALRPLTLEQRLEKLRDDDYRAQMVKESLADPPPIEFDQIFLLPVGQARYDCAADTSLAAHAERLGVSVPEAFIRVSLEREGQALWNYPFLNPNFDAVERLLDDPNVIIGLGDSGAHCGQIMDASLPTYFLKYWVQERGHFGLEDAIRMLTQEPAEVFGIADRGVLREGAYADINVIDLERLELPPPTFANDLPGGSGRYVQKSQGFVNTLVNGQVFMEGPEETGARAGVVLRSA